MEALDPQSKKLNWTPSIFLMSKFPRPLTGMIDLESKFEVLEAEVKEINANKETLKKNMLDLIELQHILVKTQ